MRQIFKEVRYGFSVMPWKLKRDLFLWMLFSFISLFVFSYVCILFPLATVTHIAIRMGCFALYLFVYYVAIPKAVLGTNMLSINEERMRFLVDKYGIKKKDS